MGSEHYISHKAQKFVADKWNIEVFRVAGISVERNLADSVSAENTKRWTGLNKTLNLDSRKRFQEEIRIEIRQIVKARKALISNKEVKRLRRRIVNRKVQTFTELESKRDEWTYVYSIYSDLKNIYTDNPRKKEFDFIINIKNGTTVLDKPDANNTSYEKAWSSFLKF